MAELKAKTHGGDKVCGYEEGPRQKPLIYALRGEEKEEHLTRIRIGGNRERKQRVDMELREG